MAEHIEREAAIEILNIAYPLGMDEAAYDTMHSMISKLPAADVVEVRHGRWVWDDNGMDWGLGAWKCSVCHSKPETWWEADKRNPYRCSGSHYCPNCGAKMDGGVNGEHA